MEHLLKSKFQVENSKKIHPARVHRYKHIRHHNVCVCGVCVCVCERERKHYIWPHILNTSSIFMLFGSRVMFCEWKTDFESLIRRFFAHRCPLMFVCLLQLSVFLKQMHCNTFWLEVRNTGSELTCNGLQHYASFQMGKVNGNAPWSRNSYSLTRDKLI